MEWADFWAIVGTTGVISVPAASLLAKLFVQHRLSKDLKVHDADITRQLAAHKAELDQRVNAAKAEYEARLKREVDDYLGNRSAQRAYEAEAKRRLYLAVGPLRLQLLLACSEYASRIRRISSGASYDMAMTAYFGRSTAYRLLRLFALCDLIERQIAFADFTVDPEMRSLLHFKRRAFASMSSHQVSLGHPREDWTRQKEHIFKDVLGVLAVSLIMEEAGAQPRVMRFDEFVGSLSDAAFLLRIEPVPRLLTNFTVKDRPLLWLRMLALGELCNALIASQGTALGVHSEPIDIQQAVTLTGDQHIRGSVERYREAVQTLARIDAE